MPELAVGIRFNLARKAVFISTAKENVMADICKDCTEPAECGEADTEEYEVDGELKSCSVRIEFDSGEGPLGERACEECYNMREDFLTTEAWGVVATRSMGWECRHGRDVPFEGHYCPDWDSIPEPDYDRD